MSNKLVIIADAKKAKICKAIGLKVKEIILELEAPESNHKRQELKQGYSTNSTKGSTQSHFLDPHSEAKNLDREDFCRQIVEKLTSLLGAGNYNELIIVAAPKMLGDLRKFFSKEQQKMVSKELSKDLINFSLDELSEHIFSH